LVTVVQFRRGRELAQRVAIRLGGQEAHLIALRVDRDLAERIAPYDLRQLVAGAHDDLDG
jgi:hypothetical protein